MAERWLHQDDIIDTVAEWTRFPRSELLGRGRPSRRLHRARVLLAYALMQGMDSSKYEVAKMMGYEPPKGWDKVRNLMKHEADESEVVEVILLAKDRARV